MVQSSGGFWSTEARCGGGGRIGAEQRCRVAEGGGARWSGGERSRKADGKRVRCGGCGGGRKENLKMLQKPIENFQKMSKIIKKVKLDGF